MISQIYDNINTHRSNIARFALNLLKVFLSDMSSNEIQAWVTWTLAVRLGELVYREPCPLGYSLDKDSPNFKKPKGFLMTNFVVVLAKPHIKSIATLHDEFGHPQALIALILVALERGFGATYAALASEYLCSIKQFKKWDEFYALCDVDLSGGDVEGMVEKSQTDIGRRALLFSSSPAKP
ncbi:hypothetical protein ONZ45_g16598 [Pleurotus djamor]|nr:hypothetical protein ONZ45_g16598 [Pleurotus djamor]